MKKHDTLHTKVYRAIKAEKLNYLTAKNAKEYSEESEIQIIRKLIKISEEELEIAKSVHRDDLIPNMESYSDALKELLPATPSLSEIEDFLKSKLTESPQNNFCENGKIPKKGMGIAIKALKLQFPTAEGKIISEIVKKYVV